MTGGILTIDQSPSRASYGLLTQTAFRQDTDRRQKEAVMQNIADIVATGDRMAKIWNKANTIPNMAAESYGYHPLDVALVPVDRPIIRWYPATGGNIDTTV